MAYNLPRSEESISSPFFVHPGENPSLALLTNLFDGTNYHAWYRSMRMALISKNKYKFVNGSISALNPDHDNYEVWERCNTLVMSWLYRSVTQTIADSVSNLDSALDVWIDLRDRFSQRDAYRIGDLQEEIYTYRQNALNCSCGLIERVRLNLDNDHVIRFMKGLNENFVTIKTQILMMEPLPEINKAFSMVIQFERQLNATGNKLPSESSVFMAKGFSESNEQGYDSNICYARVDYCYKKHGYPPGFQPRYKGESSGYVNNVQLEEQEYMNAQEQMNGYIVDQSQQMMMMNNQSPQIMNNRQDMHTQQHSNEGKIFPCTPEQYQKIMSLIQADRIGETQITAHANSLSSTFKPMTEEQGIVHACYFSSKGYRESWILDTGAIDHIICEIEFFKDYKRVQNVHVKLPTGQLIAVTHIGSVQLNSDLVLHNVLYVPMFNFNLISTSKLTDDRHLCLILYHDHCFIQDMET
ncbi:uncharacterized protein LOC126657149 [Mercurialis annua]|uniref:uncharacterized protein LOC126657149 n=1 Tax=Mercurialis annua TaxID=3986 RepID=UPI00215F8DEC|nr:uncharacterized protein LOC126657149 [Mercurialis annua]